MRIALLVHEPDIDLGGVAARARVIVLRLGVAKIGLLIGVEIDVDRIVGDERRQQAGAGHEISRSDDRPRYVTVDRCTYFRELPIQARFLQRRINRAQGSLRGRFGCDLALVLFARDGVRADQPFGAGAIGLGQFEVRNSCGCAPRPGARLPPGTDADRSETAAGLS